MSSLGGPELRVGALVIGISALIAWMSMQLSQAPDFRGQAQSAWFFVESADGLLVNSRVRMAGIPIGVIREINLKDGRARVDIVVDSDVPLRESAVVELRSKGILGDRHIELDPGRETDPPLRPGAQITNVRGGGSFDNVLDRVGGIATSLEAIADKLAMAVEGEGDRRHVLGRILLNFESLTEDLSSFTNENTDDMSRIVRDLSSITNTVKEVVNANGDGDANLKENWDRLAISLEKLEATSTNLQSITGRINDGEGTLGRLIHDESTINEINTAVENVNTFLGGARSMETSLDFGSDYFTEMDSWRTYVGIRVQPGLDRFYLAQIVDDPTGRVERERIRTVEGGSESVRDVQTTSFKDPKLTLLFGKNFYNWTIKGGLYESTGGAGVDYNFWRDRLQASLMAYSFENMNLRASLRYQPFRGVFLSGGLNDLLDNSENFSTYLGAGILLTNDDLKLLISGSAL